MSRATSEDMGGRPLRIPIGPATLEGDLEIPERRGAWCCLPMAAAAAATARGTAMSPGCSMRRPWPPSSPTSSPRKRRQWICARGTYNSTSDCSQVASSAPPTGWRGSPETTGFPIGYFGASTGAAAAVGAARRTTRGGWRRCLARRPPRPGRRRPSLGPRAHTPDRRRARRARDRPEPAGTGAARHRGETARDHPGHHPSLREARGTGTGRPPGDRLADPAP